MTAIKHIPAQQSRQAIKELEREIEKREKLIMRAESEIRTIRSALGVLRGDVDKLPSDSVIAPYRIGKKIMVPVTASPKGTGRGFVSRTDKKKTGFGRQIEEAHAKSRANGLVRTTYKWTDEEDEKLRALVERGYKNKAISEKMKRPVSGIANRRRHLGIPSRPKSLGRKPTRSKIKKKRAVFGKYDKWTKSDENELKRLVKEGYTNREIVPILNRSLRAISQKRLLLGLPTTPKAIGRAPTNLKHGRTSKVPRQVTQEVQKGEKSGFWERMLPIAPASKVPAGKKPRTVQEQKPVKKYRPYRKYSTYEDKMIAGMLRNGYGKNQIATRLRRNSGSLANRIKILKEKGKI